MRALRSLYDFITGGSIAAPVVLALGMIVTYVSPQQFRAGEFAACVVLALIAATFERVR